METAYFVPWKGKNFRTTRALILSESAYSWTGADGKIYTPKVSHPNDSICWWIKNFENVPKRGYFISMNRALCGTETPTSLGMTEAWNEYAYTIFVQGTVGFGARIRPSKEQWEDAKRHFRALIEEIRPTRVIVTGKDMWNRHMEGCDGPHLSDDLQAYRLKDGSLVWCLAVPHPSNTKQGFRWELVGESIRKFRSEKLPLRD